jgi:hypothetical protein
MENSEKRCLTYSTHHERYNMHKITSAFLAAAFLLTGCFFAKNPEYVEEIPLPPALPIGRILGNGIEAPPGVIFGDYQFELEWQRTYQGVLSPNADYGPLDTPENIQALRDVIGTWREYEEILEAAPFYPTASALKQRAGVWTMNSPRKLNNSPSLATLVLQRYWPRDWLPDTPLTKPNWDTDESREHRKTAFLAAKEKIEAQMAALQASPFWDVSYEDEGGEQQFPLRDLHQKMESFITVGEDATLYEDRPTWDEDERQHFGTALDLRKTGPLYELFFGPVPGKEEYLDQSPSALYVFPVE